MHTLPLSTIRFDGDCQSRVSLDEETVAEYAYRMEEGVAFPPLVVFFDGSDHWLADGFHRFAAHKVRARKRGDEAAVAPCDLRQGTRLDAVRHALGANAMHGKRREPGDYRKGYDIAVRCGLCDAADTATVRALLACSERWARDLTAPARDAAERERNARIVTAREAGERQAVIAAREGLSERTVRDIENRKNRQPAVSSGPASQSGEASAPFDAAWSLDPNPPRVPSLDLPDDEDPADLGSDETDEDAHGADQPIIGASISLPSHGHEREDWEDYADQISDEMADAEEAAAQVEPVPVQPLAQTQPAVPPKSIPDALARLDAVEVIAWSDLLTRMQAAIDGIEAAAPHACPATMAAKAGRMFGALQAAMHSIGERITHGNAP